MRFRLLPPAPKLVVAALAAITSLMLAVPARADDKQTCIAASDRAQQAKLEGKLQVARDQLLLCSRSECPGLIRQDCSQWMTEVIAALPSVVIGARDWQGHDVLAVKVSVDGVLVGDLTGKPFPVDPGVHTFKYESKTAPIPVEEQVLIREGEKNRNITVQFPAPAGASKPPVPPGKGTDPPPDDQAHGPSPLAYVFGGVGVVGLGAALGLYLSGTSEYNNDKKTCAPNCPNSDSSSINAKWYGAGTSLGIGVVALGVATYFFIARPSDNATAKHASVHFDFSPAPGGAVGQLTGRF